MTDSGRPFRGISVVMVAFSAVAADARVRREARTLAEAGLRVTVLGMGDEVAGEPFEFRSVSSSPTARTSLLPTATAITSMVRWAAGPTYVRRLRQNFLRAAGEALDHLPPFDVVHAHDFDTLELATDYARRRESALVYDSHEFWPGRHSPYRPTPILARRERAEERRLGSRASHVITVSQGIADWFARDYGWRNVTVVRNTFPRDLDTAPPLGPTAALYAGRAMAGRDLPTIVEAASSSPVPFQIVGPVDREMRTLLSAAAPRHLVVKDPVGIDEVTRLMRDAGIALVTLEDTCLNHQLALPNKLFQAVQAGVPVVASDLPEIRRLVASHRLGATYRAGDPSDLVRAIHEVVRDWPQFQSSVADAQPALSWAADGQRLLDVYTSLATLRHWGDIGR